MSTVKYLTAKAPKDGRSSMPEYRVWASLRDRCLNPSSAAYAGYGGRGIAVCQRWVESFEAFLQDMGRRPSSGHSIDRTNNNLGYEPNNCTWATSKVQTRNRRNNRIVSALGQELCLSEWAERTGVPFETLWSRLFELAWAPDRAMATPSRKKNSKVAGRSEKPKTGKNST